MVYSLDLRKKALNYIERGASLAEASEVFGVTTRTLSNWLQRQKQHDLAPKMHGSKPSKIDNEKLKKYIEEKFWANFKKKVRSSLEKIQNLAEAIDFSFLNILENSCKIKLKALYFRNMQHFRTP